MNFADKTRLRARRKQEQGIYAPFSTYLIPSSAELCSTRTLCHAPAFLLSPSTTTRAVDAYSFPLSMFCLHHFLPEKSYLVVWRPLSSLSSRLCHWPVVSRKLRRRRQAEKYLHSGRTVWACMGLVVTSTRYVSSQSMFPEKISSTSSRGCSGTQKE
jgi:hypothetical protein